MSDQMIFLTLLGVTAAAAGGLLMQLVWKVAGRRQARVYARLGHAPAQAAASSSTYGPIIMEERHDDLALLAERLALMQAFRKRLRRVFPNMVLSRFLSLCLGLAILGFMGSYVLMESAIVSAVAAVILFAVPFM